MKKLVRAEFAPYTPEQMKTVLSAFCKPFPSLAGLAGQDLWDWVRESWPPAGLRLQAALDAASGDGEWPGTIRRILVEYPDGTEAVDRYEIIPYVGDRKLIITNIGVLIADYSARPSAVAAGDIIELLSKCERQRKREKQPDGTWITSHTKYPKIWNDPTYTEV